MGIGASGNIGVVLLNPSSRNPQTFPIPVVLQGGGGIAGGNVFVTDPTSGLQANVQAAHNADNQAVPAASNAELVGSATQLLNPAGNFDRLRGTAGDSQPAIGIAAGAQQFALVGALTVNQGGGIVGGAAAQAVTVAPGLSGTTNGQPWTIGIGTIIEIDPTNLALREVVRVSAVAGATLTGVFANNHANGATIRVYMYNIARDATSQDGSTGAGLSASGTYLANLIFGGAGVPGWEQERSAAGEQDGASGRGTAVAAEYEYNGGGPATSGAASTGFAFDRARNLAGKGRTTTTVNGNFAAGVSSITLTSVAGLQPGQPLHLGAIGGGAFEVVYVSQSYVQGTLAVALQSPTLFLHNGDAANFDIYAVNGPGLNGFMATGLGIEEESVFDPVTGLYFIERSATQDAMPAANIVAETPALWNGAAMDRGRSASAANQSAAVSGVGVELTAGPGNWTASAQSTAAQTSASRAAGGVGVRHVCKGISASIACGATAQTPLAVNLRDGATGAGTVLRTWSFAAVAGAAYAISENDLNIFGSANTAMTLEFAGATQGNVLGSMNLNGYDCQ